MLLFRIAAVAPLSFDQRQDLSASESFVKEMHPHRLAAMCVIFRMSALDLYSPD